MIFLRLSRDIAEESQFKAVVLWCKKCIYGPLCASSLCVGADSLSNWFAVVYMSIKAPYSAVFERYIVQMLHVMNAQ